MSWSRVATTFIRRILKCMKNQVIYIYIHTHSSAKESDIWFFKESETACLTFEKNYNNI